MGKYSHLSATELQRKIEVGEIDLYDAIEIPWPTSWSVQSEADEIAQQNDPEENMSVAVRSKQRKKPRRTTAASGSPRQRDDFSVARYFVVKIRLQGNRVYELARIPIQTDISTTDQEEEIFNQFVPKLDKQYVHVRTPMHRAIRTSIVEELFVDRAW